MTHSGHCLPCNPWCHSIAETQSLKLLLKACRRLAGQQRRIQTLTPAPCGRDSGGGVVAGCRVASGALKSSLTFRVLRDGAVVHEGRAESIKRAKLAVRARQQPLPCCLTFYCSLDCELCASNLRPTIIVEHMLAMCILL